MTWVFKQIKPQKARGKFVEALWQDPAWSAETKFDGDRRIAQFCPSGLVRFTGCRESVDGTGFVEKSAQVPHLSCIGHLLAMTQRVKAMAGTVLDGEMVAPLGKEIKGGRSKYVTSIMGSSPWEAVRKQREGGFLCYVAFDCLWYKGEDLRSAPLVHRRHFLFEAVKQWSNDYVHQAHAYTKESEKRRAWESADEGLVFKYQDHEYGQERWWVKLKKEATADVVAIGFKKGKGKYAGMVGAIEFGQWRTGSMGTQKVLKSFGTARGFTDQAMKDMGRHPSHYLGKVFRIKHNGREPTGAFRHPRFDVWRPDKGPRDCVYDPEET